MRNMFVIALITGRLEIGKAIVDPVYKLGNDILGDYLVGVIICRNIEKTLPYEFMSLTEIYTKTADHFENCAIELLTSRFHQNPRLTEQLLTRQLPHWGNQSCIELAIVSRSRLFIAHQSVQRLLKAIWRGTENPTQQLEIGHYISFVFPFVAPLVLEYSEFQNESYFKRLCRFFYTPRSRSFPTSQQVRSLI